MMRVPQKGAPLGTRSGNAMPPFEKQNGAPRGNAPNLNASSSKTLNKAPLTPRVAGSAASLASNPLARMGGNQNAMSSPASSQKADFPIPVVAFMSNNITPRSSSRKTRVDSASSTPTHTPSGTPAPDGLRAANDGIPNVLGGLNIVDLESSPLKRPKVSFSPSFSDTSNQRNQAQFGPDRRFFYASDAKVAVQQPKQRATQENKTSRFFYANGETVPTPTGSAGGSVVGSTISEERRQPRFFHANGTPDLKLQPPQHTPPTGLPAAKFELAAPGLAPRSLGSAFSLTQRPMSPPKINHDVPISTLNYTSPRSSEEIARFQATQDASSPNKSDAQTSWRAAGHERSTSIGVLDSSPSPQQGPNMISAVSPVQLLPTSAMTAGLIASPENLPSDDGSGVSLPSDLQSPVKAGFSLEHMNELAANARRERKVLDLEITNSSLAAINRTLEREMRKQTAELRRYRRLSRSGRLSIATSTSMRTSSGTLSIIESSDGIPLSDTSEGSECDDEDEQTSDEESVDESSLSPTAMAENDARHRKMDERRLQVDLSKHQQLLIDSQNINQSLKRCLGWTEELISEGKKALAYHVHVSDIELGGRVLAPDELDDAEHDGLFEDTARVQTRFAENVIAQSCLNSGNQPEPNQ